MKSLKDRAAEAEVEFRRRLAVEKSAEKARRKSEGREATLRDFGGVDLRVAPLPVARIDVAFAHTPAGVVYVVWPVGDAYVKIGVTQAVLERMAGMQTGNPRALVLLVTFHVGTGGWTEPRLHDRFREQRAIGEWFRLEGELAEWLGPALAEARAREGLGG